MLELIPLSTVLNMVLLLIYASVVTRINSFTVLLAGATILEILHLSVSTYLHRLFGIEEFAYAVFHLWYLTFAITDFLLVFFVLYLCKKLNSPLQLGSKVVLSLFFFLGWVQVASYLERLYLSSAFLDPFYRSGIPVVNGIITAVLFIQFVYDFVKARNQREDDAYL